MDRNDGDESAGLGGTETAVVLAAAWRSDPGHLTLMS